MNRIGIALLLFVLSLSGSVQAATIGFDGLAGPGIQAMNFTGFERFSVNGMPQPVPGSWAAFDGSETMFEGEWIDNGLATAITQTIYWVDPNAPTLIDQFVNWTITPSGVQDLARIKGSFYTDDRTTAAGDRILPPGTLPADVIVEQLLGAHNPFLYVNANLTLEAFAESPKSLPEVPLPATIWLFGSALIGFAGFGTKRKAATVN